jgi:hypothetical protein
VNNIWKISVFFILIFFVNNAYACKTLISINKFKIDKKIRYVAPEKPNFVLKGINRGEKIKDNTSCSYLWTLGTISLKPKTPSKVQQGYIFEIIEGKLEKNNIFKPYPVVLTHSEVMKETYHFKWSDGDSDLQEPFNIKIKITSVSLSGVKSDPQYLRISHRGVKIQQKKYLPSTSQVFNSSQSQHLFAE